MAYKGEHKMRQEKTSLNLQSVVWQVMNPDPDIIATIMMQKVKLSFCKIKCLQTKNFLFKTFTHKSALKFRR